MVTFERVESTNKLPAGSASLLAAWQEFNAQGSPPGNRPTRSDFTPFVLKPWLGNIDVYDVEDGGNEFRMRLNGTRVVELTGEDWTGKTARDVDRRFGFTLHDELHSVFASKLSMSHWITIFQKDYLTAHRLLLPIFSDLGDGEVVQIFLAIFCMAED